MNHTEFLARTRSRMRRSAAFAGLGLVLTVLGFSMRLLHLEQPAAFHNAWQMFAALSALLMCQALSRFFKARRILNSPDFYQQRSRIEENDERTALIEQKSWTTLGRAANFLLFAAMLICLAVEAMGAFWVFYWETVLLNAAYLALSRYYGGRL